ncbi:UDP-N-acetylmuramoyl-tripeptide--D-alanyl-D-alanine ligase [Sneathiella glossodoripedis]|uniref:UDP-N-acetylmuramoyl-tripeptide--D-alanyl-D- alanine ligase n=1 Tax=Sneathiella glossodoripedis TaxID=418853 RepID=UPI0004708E66|nr:UDP-N-acetylmuramoyl-tripeptide--D-alanyl-D-alanine ligase [Sneathiella glossodoripedis]
MADLPLWTAEEVAQAIGVDVHDQQWQATGVSIDSRTVEKGDLFIAIVGPANDGHDYVANALERGAVAAIVSSSVSDCPEGANLLFVADTQVAMEKLGVAARTRTSAKVIAVTGSVGKTGTKEALAHCLKEQGKTHYSVGSFNNHWGVPLSLARMPANTEYAVFELGMNHAGELGPLSRFVRPDVAIITTIAIAHLEFFKDKSEIAFAKSEIFEGLAKEAYAIINADIEESDQLQRAALQLGVRQLITFGEVASADARLEAIKILPHSSEISANICGHKLDYILSVPGEHWAMNSLAVLAAIKAIGADIDKASNSLASMAAPGGRGAELKVLVEGGSFVIIDESYNASPIAMQAAFKVLASHELNDGGRKILVVGDMRELGEKSPEIHASLANDVLASGADMVYACGSYMQHLVDALPKELIGGYTAHSDELAPLVAQSVKANDVVLIKGSLGSKMKVVLDALLALSVDQNPAGKVGS